MSCNCNSQDLHRFEVSGQGSSCSVAPAGGSPLPGNEIEITLGSEGPDCVKLEFAATYAMVARRPPPGSWICDQSPAPGQSSTLVWMIWQVPYQSGASQSLTWQLDTSSSPCTIKITIQRE